MRSANIILLAALALASTITAFPLSVPANGFIQGLGNEKKLPSDSVLDLHRDPDHTHANVADAAEGNNVELNYGPFVEAWVKMHFIAYELAERLGNKWSKWFGKVNPKTEDGLEHGATSTGKTGAKRSARWATMKSWSSKYYNKAKSHASKLWKSYQTAGASPQKQ